MSTDPDHTTDGPYIDGLFDALDWVGGARARTPKPTTSKSRCQCKGTSRREH
jgi:hypothetical protein